MSQVPTWVEDGGHVLIGLIPGWGVLRERIQLPPQNDRYPVKTIKTVYSGGAYIDEYWAASRVMDIFRDLAGYAVGDLIRTAILVGLLWWRW